MDDRIPEWFDYHGPNIGIAGIIFALCMWFLHGPSPLMAAGIILAVIGFGGWALVYICDPGDES